MNIIKRFLRELLLGPQPAEPKSRTMDFAIANPWSQQEWIAAQQKLGVPGCVAPLLEFISRVGWGSWSRPQLALMEAGEPILQPIIRYVEEHPEWHEKYLKMVGTDLEPLRDVFSAIGDKSLQPLVDLLHHQLPYLRLVGCSALHRTAGRDRWLDESDDNERDPGAWIAAVPLLINSLRDEYAPMRQCASSVLQELGVAAAPAVPNLVALLLDEDAAVRHSAVSALESIGRPAIPAIPDLTRCLQDPAKEVRKATEQALATLDRKSKSTSDEDLKPKVVKVGHAFAFPLCNGKWGICRIVGVTVNMKVAITRWVSDDMPQELPKPSTPFYPRLETLVLNYGDHEDRRATYWFRKEIPSTFKRIGLIPIRTDDFPASFSLADMDSEEMWGVGRVSWDDVSRYCYEQWEWENDTSPKAQEERAKKDELRKQRAVDQQQAEASRKIREARKCPRCGKIMRYGSHSSWPSGGVWWCDTVNQNYGCGYEITPATHPAEFPNYDFGGRE